MDAQSGSVASLSFLRRAPRPSLASEVDPVPTRTKRDRGPSTTLESFRRAPLLTRTVITVLSLVAVFSVFVGVLSVVAVSATQAIFPPPESEQPLASPTGAGEADAAPAKKSRAKGEPTE